MLEKAPIFLLLDIAYFRQGFLPSVCWTVRMMISLDPLWAARMLVYGVPDVAEMGTYYLKYAGSRRLREEQKKS